MTPVTESPSVQPVPGTLVLGRPDHASPVPTAASSREGEGKPGQASKRTTGFATWAYTLLALGLFVWLSSLLDFWPLLLLAGVALYYTAQWALGSDGAIRAMHAVPADQHRYPDLHRHVAEMSAAAGIETPDVFVSGQPTHNAWAARLPGRGVVGFTDALLADLDESELRAVIAHEVGHLRNRDTFISSVLRTLAVSIMTLVALPGFLITTMMAAGASKKTDEEFAEWLRAGVVVLASFVANAFVSLGSRRRELLADDASAELCNPVDLARALDKLERLSRQSSMPMTPALAAVAPQMFINPFAGSLINRILSSHPSTKARIRRIHHRLPSDIAEAMAVDRAAREWEETRDELESEVRLVSHWRGDTPDAHVSGRHALKRTDVVYLEARAVVLRADPRSGTWTVDERGEVPVVVTSRGVHVGGYRRQNWLFDRWAGWECTSVNNAPALLVRRIGTKRPVGLAFTAMDGRAELGLTIWLALASDSERMSRAQDLQRQLAEHMAARIVL